MYHLLDNILQAHKRGDAVGIPSLCSAHPWVLRTALRGDFPVLVESTCNQVNQFGGYTGMTPADFVAFVQIISAENGFPPDRILLGGDHLGPSPWQDAPAELAMPRAIEMVQAYVRAGYTKLHIDASMKLGDDQPDCPLDQELAAQRTAVLVNAAELVADPLVSYRYIIGTEVPIPGGATAPEKHVHVTAVEDAQHTLELTHTAFVEAGLESAWERVVALVVQPGVEFGDDFVLDYDPAAGRALARFAETIPLVYEAHSTDYQSRSNLQALVRDHFAILKVGPALTYAFREATFALAMIEKELFPAEERSRLIETLEQAMLRNPRYWQAHYHGTQLELAYARKFSRSDRIRYYWSDPDVQDAFAQLLKNLAAIPLPLSLINHLLPDLQPASHSGQVSISASSIIHSRIQNVLDDYSYACGKPDFLLAF